MAVPKGPFVRSPYNYDVVAAADECCVKDFGPKLTLDSQKEEADINVILKRFGITGQLPTGVRVPTYGDFTEVRDYKSAMDAIALANSSFMEMPADIRAEFQNDPQRFVEFCSDEKNLPRMREIGLAVPKPAEPASSGVQGAEPPAPAVKPD